MQFPSSPMNILLMAPCLPNLVSGVERLGSSHSHIEVIGDPLTFESQIEPSIDRPIHQDVVGIPPTLDFVSSSQIEVEQHEDESSSHVKVDESLALLDVGNQRLDGILVGDNQVPLVPITRKLRKVDGPLDLANKESLRDVSIPLAQPSLEQRQGDRSLQNCQSNEKWFKFDMTTDNYGFETTWELVKKNGGGTVLSGPPTNSNYADNTRYIGGKCLGPGNYEFTIKDKYQDGMCKNGTGKGSYEITLDNVQKGKSPSCGTKWSTRTHSFSVEGSSNNGNNNSNNNNAIESSFRSGCTNVEIEIKMDSNGFETTAFLKDKSGSNVLSSEKNIGANKSKTLSKCLPSGDYTFTIKDFDGICCRYGNGYFKISLDGTEVVKGDYFIGSKSYTIKVGFNYQSGMSARDKEWLNAHNSRRRTHHKKAGKTVRNLKWSSTLANDAKKWANSLLSDCNNSGIKHEKNIEAGENLAKNKGQFSDPIILFTSSLKIYL
ncbi:hypothetical protein ACHAXS_002462 [Conticribra weissflogii]